MKKSGSSAELADLKPAAEGAAGGRVRILLAEDNAINMKVALGILKRTLPAADVVTAENGVQVRARRRRVGASGGAGVRSACRAQETCTNNVQPDTGRQGLRSQCVHNRRSRRSSLAPSLPPEDLSLQSPQPPPSHQSYPHRHPNHSLSRLWTRWRLAPAAWTHSTWC